LAEFRLWLVYDRKDRNRRRQLWHLQRVQRAWNYNAKFDHNPLFVAGNCYPHLAQYGASGELASVLPRIAEEGRQIAKTFDGADPRGASVASLTVRMKFGA
jgi:hypothetical protein